MNDAYDPNATEDEAAGRSQYMSLKDLRVIGIILVVLGALLYPVYRIGVRNRDKALCVQNMKAIYEAMFLYAENHDDGLPPLMRANPDGTPILGESGLPYTWVSDIAPFMSKRASFVCPSADPSEYVWNEDQASIHSKIPSTYGFYAAYSGIKASNIENRDQVILISETSNHGSMTSYDPLPFKDATGKDAPDGFAIGWSDNNLQGTSQSKTITRLAFRDSATGDTSKAYGRHDAGIHAVTASGQRLILKPAEAQIVHRDKLPAGFWLGPALRR